MTAPDLDALRADAVRYRWLREQAPDAICSVAWRQKGACAYGEPDAALDAAIAAQKGKGPLDK